MEQKTFGSKLTMLLVIVLVCFIIGQTFSTLIMMARYGFDVVNIEYILSNPKDNFHSIRVAQIIATITSFLLPALIFSKLVTQSYFHYPAESINDKTTSNLLYLLIPGLVITIYPFLNLTYILNQHSFLGDLLKDQQSQYKLFIEALTQSSSIVILVFNFVMIAILPAIAEEWLFRGTLQKLLSERCNIHLAIFASAIIFSLIHFEFSAFLPRIVLGMFLGYLFYFTGNIWYSVAAHLFNNGMEVILMYLRTIKIIEGNALQEPTMPSTAELTSFSLAFIAFMMLFYTYAQKNKNTTFVAS